MLDMICDASALYSWKSFYFFTTELLPDMNVNEEALGPNLDKNSNDSALQSDINSSAGNYLTL